MMNRRLFLRALVAGGAGLVLDPERLLWVPGAKTIFVPPIEGWYDDASLVTPAWVTQEILRLLHQQIAFSEHVYRRYDDDAYACGATISLNTTARR